jgi:hypothetical protein
MIPATTIEACVVLMVGFLLVTGCTSEIKNVPAISSVYTDSSIYGVEPGSFIVVPSIGGVAAIHILNESGRYHIYAKTVNRGGSARIYYVYKSVTQRQDRFGTITDVDKACTLYQDMGSNCLLGITNDYDAVDRVVEIPENGMDFSVVVVFQESAPVSMRINRVSADGREEPVIL